MLRVAILTISDKGSRGERIDESGPSIADCLRAAGYKTVWYDVVPDEQSIITDKLVKLCDEQKVDVVLTTGGTGLSPRDVTPEATLQIAERVVPGISEAIRTQTALHSSRAMLSRGVSVIRKSTLIINLPGSPKAVRECMLVILPVLAHAVAVLKGTVSDCAASS